ncbi:hypothetical protein COV13_00190 [Candidatus Woesearchaeota archaeon CG10_big_fil_rev_8_21_14_0_10_32_9]|nr:MAG: hypothetical protein COV13_00190 [Candidatus Woesearchaeota archaeon CG10_big_fil_rev_8_21_14_0_10_32_9]
MNKNLVLFPPLPNRIKVIFTKSYWNFLKISAIYLERNLDVKFADLLKTSCGIHNPVFLDSASSAIVLALNDIDLSKGDEVIIPSFVCKAVIHSVLVAGGTPVFADIGKDFNLSSDSVKKAISSKTKAVIAVHQYGKLCRIDEIKKLCVDKKIFLIEDAAVPIGLKHKNLPVGSFGDYSVFSFNMGKTIVSMGGGILVSNKKEFNLPQLRNKLAIKKYVFFLTNIYFKKFFVVFFIPLSKLGIIKREENIKELYSKTNLQKISIKPSKMHRLQKALTVFQLRNLENINESTQLIAKTYIQELKTVKQIELPNSSGNQFTIFPIKTNDRYSLSVFLSKHGIETQWTFYPLHLQNKFSKYSKKSVSLKNTELLWKQELSLPIGPTMTKKQAEYVCKKIKEFYTDEKRV